MRWGEYVYLCGEPFVTLSYGYDDDDDINEMSPQLHTRADCIHNHTYSYCMQ